MSPRAHLTIGQLSERSGVATSALRYYEDLGLIASERSAGNQRRYPPHMLRRVAFVRSAQRVGLTLEEVAEALATLPEGHQTVIQAREAVKDGDEVAVLGRIGGSVDPWVAGRAAFQGSAVRVHGSAGRVQGVSLAPSPASGPGSRRSS